MAMCATCGKANADHLVFCEDCGARLAPRIAPPTPPIGVPMPPAAAEGIRCARCGATSAPGMRFCITCGSPIEAVRMPAAVPAPAPVPAPAAPIAGGMTAPIAPSLVAVVAPAPPLETRTCKRCQGTSDKNAQFCRFCGALLAESPNVSPIVPMIRPTMPSAAVPALVAQQEVAQQQGRLDTTLVTNSSPVAALEAAAAPVAKPNGKLVVVHKDGGLGASFALLDQLDIGRVEGECLFADDRYMAPRHARVTRKDGTLFVRDLGTANGVYFRLRKDEKPTVLEDQDLILLGQQVLRFEIVKDAEGGFGAAFERDTLVFGTPAAPRYARLFQRTTEGVSCDVFHIRKPETVFGRESGDVVFPDDPFMSRRHASITVVGPSRSTFQLADLGSSNGTFIRIHGEVSLQHGDEIRVGQQLLRVDLG
jgi:pSer/pThr/pTyr-binding forkhead associated (FHA) protein